MKTKKLIKLLKEADPSGNLEVSVGNHDIFTAYTLPNYYDGYQQVLIRDKKLEPYYDVVGGKYLEEGIGVVIQTLDLKGAIACDPDIPISYSEETKKYKKEHDRLRKEFKEIVKGK